MIKHDITLPFLSDWNIHLMKKYSHIWRDGGIRLERETINNK
jgi:hypothetical protein